MIIDQIRFKVEAPFEGTYPRGEGEPHRVCTHWTLPREEETAQWYVQMAVQQTQVNLVSQYIALWAKYNFSPLLKIDSWNFSWQMRI